MKKRVITRIKGGLGNQLFCYAAARRLALVNDAELVIDDVTGFIRERQYRRQYVLDKFNIKARKATPAERMEPFERGRRGVVKCLERMRPLHKRRYLEQEGMDFDPRLLDLKVKGTLYLEGYWQSEKYFKDVEEVIRRDLKITPPGDSLNQDIAEKIRQSESVAVHVRWFDPPGYKQKGHNALKEYYEQALAEMQKGVKGLRYFLFSDDPVSARKFLNISEEVLTCVTCNNGAENSYADLWLMRQCKHFIIANSTFSWWGAWLSESQPRIVISPDMNVEGIAAWGFQGLIPDEWITIK